MIELVAAAIVLQRSSPPPLPPARVAFWTRVHECEEPGSWYQRGTVFVSGLGIYAPNWRKWARALKITSAPWQTKPLDQMRVADFGYRTDHAYWGCFAQVGTPP